MSGLTGYITSSGTDLSSVFLNISGVIPRQSGTLPSGTNIAVPPNVPLYFVAYLADGVRSGMAYVYVFNNSVGGGMSGVTFVPANNPISGITYTSSNIRVTCVNTSFSFNYFFINLSVPLPNTGFISNGLDLSTIFKNICGYTTVSGTYVNSSTSQTISIPLPNVPYQL